MTRPQFPPNLLDDVDDLERRLAVLERSGGLATVPTGAISAFWGTTAPTGWLLCNGASFSVVTYPALAALLGGTTLPNLKGRIPVGIDGAQTEFDTLGETGGVKTMTNTQMPSHRHPINLNTDNETGTHVHNAINVYGTSDPAHGHYIGGPLGEGSSAPQNSGGGTGRAPSTWAPATTDETGHHIHAIADDTDLTGSGAAGGNMPPYMALAYIIKT